jgi:hypothetical protein
MLRLDEEMPNANMFAAMFAAMGNMFGLAATVFATIICVGVAIGFLYSANEGDPTIQIVGLILAGAIWLIGRACRYVLAGR